MSRPAAQYLRFAAAALGATLLLALLGYWPTKELAGPPALAALVAGCTVSFLASVIGGLPLFFRREGAMPIFNAFASMGLRLLVVVALGTVAALSGRFPTRPLLLWLAIAYVALLAVDTAYAVRTSTERPEQDDANVHQTETRTK